MRPPKYDEPEELLYWIVPWFIVVVPENPLLLPETVNVPAPAFVKYPLPVNLFEIESFTPRLYIKVAPFMATGPPKNVSADDDLLNWIAPPLIVVVPVNAVLFPDMERVPEPDFMNVPPPVRKLEFDILLEILNSSVFPLTFVVPEK